MTPGKNDRQAFQIPWEGLFRLMGLAVMMLTTLLLSAGRWDWWEAWAYSLSSICVLLGSRAYIILKQPDLVTERSAAHQYEDVKAWDKYLMPLTVLVGPFISWVIAGLDQRFGWSPDLPDWVQITALLIIQLGSLLGSWAMGVNNFFSSHVRIQTDRGHEVVRKGPYRCVRHPGYAGVVISWLATPAFFSSWWLIVPALLMIAATVFRTLLEDRVLQAELPGYPEYTGEVKFRLIPGVW